MEVPYYDDPVSAARNKAFHIVGSGYHRMTAVRMGLDSLGDLRPIPLDDGTVEGPSEKNIVYKGLTKNALLCNFGSPPGAFLSLNDSVNESVEVHFLHGSRHKHVIGSVEAKT